MSEQTATMADTNITTSMPAFKKGIIPRAPATSWIILTLLWGIFAINASCREVINKVMPLIVTEFGMTATVSGLIGTIGTVGTGILAIPISRWADRRGQAWHRRKTMFAVAFLYCLLTILVGIPAITTGVVMLAILQFFKFGMAGGGETIEVANTAEWWPVEERGFVIGAHHTGYPWGTTLTILVIAGILVASNNNWRLTFIIVPLLAIPFWVVFWAYATKKRFAKCNEKMRAMGLTPSITVEVVDAAEEARKNKSQVVEEHQDIAKTPMLKLFKNPNVLGCFICYAGIIGAFFGLSYWLTPYLAFIADYNYAQAAAYSIFFTITGGLGQIFWGSFSDKIGCKRTLLICTVWLLAGFMLLPQINRGLGWLVGIQLFLGFCMNAGFPIIYSFSSGSVKKTEMATAIGICNTSMIIGGCVPFLLGVFINIGGGWTSEGGYMSGLVFMIVALVIAFLAILLLTHDVVGPRCGKDWALTSYKSCGIDIDSGKK